jgi:mono/diheme cytochrome c family protein
VENCQGRSGSLKRSAFWLVLLAGFSVWPALAGDPSNGAQIYASRCAYCHGTKGHSDMPGLPDFSWRGMGNNGLMKTDQHLLTRVASGGRGCPSFGGILSSQEILDVITHLRSLR